MKNLLILFLFLFFGKAFAQDEETLDTIYANESTNISLFFPSQIRQGITGAPNFTFGYNGDKAQYFGLLKAVPGSHSNLLVLTMDGQVYSYILKYRKNLPKLNYFIDRSESIGIEFPQKTTSDSTPSARENKGISRAHLGRLSAFYLRNTKGNVKTKRKDGLVLKVKDLIYYGNETFMIFELENRSRIDFQLNYLNVYVSQGNKKRNASYQKLLKTPVYTFKLPEVVKPGQKNKFAYVLPKFTIGDNEKIEVEVREKRGNRFLILRFK